MVQGTLEWEEMIIFMKRREEIGQRMLGWKGEGEGNLFYSFLEAGAFDFRFRTSCSEMCIDRFPEISEKGSADRY